MSEIEGSIDSEGHEPECLYRSPAGAGCSQAAEGDWECAGGPGGGRGCPGAGLLPGLHRPGHQALAGRQNWRWRCASISDHDPFYVGKLNL